MLWPDCDDIIDPWHGFRNTMLLSVTHTMLLISAVLMLVILWYLLLSGFIWIGKCFILKQLTLKFKFEFRSSKLFKRPIYHYCGCKFFVTALFVFFTLLQWLLVVRMAANHDLHYNNHHWRLTTVQGDGILTILMTFLITFVTRRWVVELWWNEVCQREEDYVLLPIETFKVYMVVRKCYRNCFCTGVNGNHELWLAHSHSAKVKEVNNNNETFWLVKRKGLF